MNNIAPKLQKCWTHKIVFKIISKMLKQPNFLQSAFYASKGSTCKVLPFYDFWLSFIISSVAPNRSSTFYVYLTLFGLWGCRRVFAKYRQNSLADLHETLWLLRPLYRSSFKKLKVWGQVNHCCHGNQLIGECLAKNMIKKGNFSKIFSNLSQIMLKLGRNIQWVEILWNWKNFWWRHL